MDHSGQGAGQPWSELWDSVPSAGSPTHGAQRTVLGLRHRGEALTHYLFTIYHLIHMLVYSIRVCNVSNT